MMPTRPISWIYIGSVLGVGVACLIAKPSALHAIGWTFAVLATGFYTSAEEDAREYLYELTHFDPRPPMSRHD